ncbi:MAG: glycoside hydrolase domain-containing protein, partial [Gemmatimonadota bacterium]
MKPVCLLALLCFGSPAVAPAQEPVHRTGTWERDSLGNHRAVVRVSSAAPAVRVVIPWRRRDSNPGMKEIVVLTGSGERVRNVAPIRMEQASGEIVFEPIAGTGDYYVYYMHYTGTFRSPYPKISYPPPVDTADPVWLRASGVDSTGISGGAWRRLPSAMTVALDAVDEFNRMDPMELVASPS